MNPEKEAEQTEILNLVRDLDPDLYDCMTLHSTYTREGKLVIARLQRHLGCNLRETFRRLDAVRAMLHNATGEDQESLQHTTILTSSVR